MNYFINAFKNFAQFDGRANRQEFWMFNLIYILLSSVLFSLGYFVSSMFMYLYYILALVALIPSLAITSRRLHDVNKSGWFILIIIIPLIGAIWLLILCCTNGVEGINKFGEEPSMN